MVSLNTFAQEYSGLQSNSTRKKQTTEQAVKLLLSDLNAQPESSLREKIVSKAEQGYYSNRMSSIGLPQMQLSIDLRDAGYEELAGHAQKGKYND